MADSTLLIVVEWQSDAIAIRALLGDELVKRTRFFAAQGRASLVTVARNLLVHEGGPILIVMDADTTTLHLVEEQKTMAQAALESLLPGAKSSWDGVVEVFTFIPTIEVLFFEAPDALELILGKSVPQEKLRDGLLAPATTIRTLFSPNGSVSTEASILQELQDVNVANLISQGKQATALRETIRSMLSLPVATP